MSAVDAGGDSERDLVVVTLPAVQRFITEARSTADVAAASGIYERLAAVIAGTLHGASDAEPVLPAESPGEHGPGTPNRIVVRLPHGTGARAAADAARAAKDAWAGWVREVFGDRPPVTPGFPTVLWACVPPEAGGFPEQWDRARQLLEARRRVRDFAAVPEEQWRERALCSLTPRWPAEPAPRRVPEHEKKSRLSAVGWVKRRWHHIHGLERFPSTSSIASAPYRKAVLARLDDPEVRAAAEDMCGAEREFRRALRGYGRETTVPGLVPVPEDDPGRWLAVDGGPWVYPDRWEPETLPREHASDRGGEEHLLRDIRRAADRGRAAAERLQGAMKDSPAAYLAVVVQDLDSMGLFLSGKAGDQKGRKIPVSPNGYRRLSRDMASLADKQNAKLRGSGILGLPVYAGGDDLLAFTPAATALDAAVTCHDVVPDTLPYASTAVLYFHHNASIQQAMSEARRLLDLAKKRVHGKHGLAIGYLRRSGASEASIQPWTADRHENSAKLFGLFSLDARHRLSPRLLNDLDRDAVELASLAMIPGGRYQAELARLVRRHTEGDGGRPSDDGIRSIAGALAWLGEQERSPHNGGSSLAVRPQPAARVGVFIRQEARAPQEACVPQEAR